MRSLANTVSRWIRRQSSGQAGIANDVHPKDQPIPDLAQDCDQTDPKLSILNDGWGHARSLLARLPVDQEGNALPWYTYPAIEYLRQLDVSTARVFEWGSGNSSLFWSDRAKEVISIEWDKVWFERSTRDSRPNLETKLVNSDPAYSDAISNAGMFDIIVIDGRQRRACAQNAMGHWNEDGIIILDNSDWYIKATEYLRSQGLLQIDFSGFGPINNYTWSTSVFLKGVMPFQPLHDRLPMPGVGAIYNIAEEDQG